MILTTFYDETTSFLYFTHKTENLTRSGFQGTYRCWGLQIPLFVSSSSLLTYQKNLLPY